MQRSDSYDYGNAYIVLKRVKDLLAAAANGDDEAEKYVVFKSNVPFRLCISDIKHILMDNSGDLDIVLQVCDLLEYSYKITIIL